MGLRFLSQKVVHTALKSGVGCNIAVGHIHWPFPSFHLPFCSPSRLLSLGQGLPAAYLVARQAPLPSRCLVALLACFLAGVQKDWHLPPPPPAHPWCCWLLLRPWPRVTFAGCVTAEGSPYSGPSCCRPHVPPTTTHMIVIHLSLHT